jgi:hypothetical protein
MKKSIYCCQLFVFLITLLIASTASAAVSDDFSSTTLNTGLWTFVDPLNDARWHVRNACGDSACGTDTMPGQMG